MSYLQRKGKLMKGYTPENLRQADEMTMRALGIPGVALMEKAADALFDAIKPQLRRDSKIVILCGKGNNGGDGWALGMKLANLYHNVVCVPLFGDSASYDAMYYFVKCRECENMGYPMRILDACDRRLDAFGEIKTATVIVDGIFGTGFSGEIDRGTLAADVIELANSVTCFKVAADIPSGVDALTGRCAAYTFRADITVSFAKIKVGMLSYPARNLCGNITVADIGIPEQIFDSIETKYEIADTEAVRKYLPARHPESNKGTFGRLLVYAGSPEMTGAAHLALSGALRTGVGLTVFAGDLHVTSVLQHRLSEPVYLPVSDTDEDTDKLVEYSKKCSVMLIGCGLGTSDEVKKRVIRLVKECECPIILDADGINVLSDNINVITEAKKGILLTPHPVEFSRVSGLTLENICDNRIECTAEFSKKYGCNILLKGAGTIICSADGRICINPIACSALAKGGSGDVLAGMIASFAAQGVGLYESAVIGAYLHGCAGEELAREYSEYGVMPSDIPEHVARMLARK